MYSLNWSKKIEKTFRQRYSRATEFLEDFFEIPPAGAILLAKSAIAWEYYKAVVKMVEKYRQYGKSVDNLLDRRVVVLKKMIEKFAGSVDNPLTREKS